MTKPLGLGVPHLTLVGQVHVILWGHRVFANGIGVVLHCLRHKPPSDGEEKRTVSLLSGWPEGQELPAQVAHRLAKEVGIDPRFLKHEEILPLSQVNQSLVFLEVKDVSWPTAGGGPGVDDVVVGVHELRCAMKEGVLRGVDCVDPFFVGNMFLFLMQKGLVR